MIYILDLRGRDIGGPVLPGRLIEEKEDQLRLEPKVTFLLHGFNVNRKKGAASLSRLAEHLCSQVTHGAMVAVLWPGDHWVRPLSYPFEGNDADDSAAELARYIDRVIPPSVELRFVSHSLGARVVMETVSRLDTRRHPVRQICLLAPAIDDFSLANPCDYRKAVVSAKRTAVLASRKDTVLGKIYPIGDLLQAFIYWSKDRRGSALGFNGPIPFKEQPIPDQVYHAQIPDERCAGHSDYIPDTSANPNQLSAVKFAGEILQEAAAPKYS